MTVVHLEETLPNGVFIEATYTQRPGESDTDFDERVDSSWTSLKTRFGG